MSSTPADRDLRVPALLNQLYIRVASTGSASYGRAFDLGIMDYRVLDALAGEPGIAARRIVEIIGIDKGSVSRALKNLDARGLLIAASPEDRRRLVYALSAKGVALHNQAQLLARERERLTVDGISAEDQERLVAILQTMLGNIDKLKALAAAQTRRSSAK